MIRAEFEGFNELKIQIKRFKKKLPILMGKIITGIMMDPIARDAQKKAPYKTGHLRANIKVFPTIRTRNTITGFIGVDLKKVIYARLQEYGSAGLPGGVIKAKIKPYLVFPRPGGGGFVRTKSVRVPAHPYLRPAIEKNIRRAKILFYGELNREIERYIREI